MNSVTSQLLEIVFVPCVAAVTPAEETEEHSSKVTKARFFAYILQIGLWIAAIYLSWNCYGKNSSIFIRILIAFFAAAFSVFFIPFYIIYNVILGKGGCGGGTGGMGMGRGRTGY